MSLVSPGDPGRDVDDEIRVHIEERVDLLVAEGWDPDDARREAERRFGDLEGIRDELLEIERRERRTMRTRETMRSWTTDAVYALRGLRKNPIFSVAIVATLALGIGAATAIFAVADAVLMRPLAFRDAERWVEVNQARDDNGYVGGLAADRLPEWRRTAEGLLGAWVGYVRDGLVRTDGERAQKLEVVAVTPGADTLLGIPLLMGRGPSAEDGRPGAPPVGVLSRAYWERTGADPDVLGTTLRLESGPVTVVGVLAGGMRFPTTGDDPDLWLPLRDDFTYADREIRGVQGVWARLPEGTSTETAQGRLDVLAGALQERLPSERTWRVRLVPLDAHRANPDVRQALWTLAATVGAIFLIALVNGVNLLLVRTSARSREIAVRTAIGASRPRLLRQLVVEGLMLGLLAGGAAVALAWLAVRLMQGIVPSEVLWFSPHAFEVEGRTLLFASSVAVAAGLLLGLIPFARVLAGRTPVGSLAGRDASGPKGRRLRDGLVVGQVALSMTLLVAAGLLVNGFARLMAVEPGFDVERVALGDLELAPTRYPDAAARGEFARRFEEALESRPEIEAVAVKAGSGFSFGAALEAEGRPVRDDQPGLVPHAAVGADYFRTMGMELVEGRGFEEADVGTDAVVVDADLARFLWGRERAAGRRFRMGEDGEWMTVVGVVDELMMMGRDQREGPYQFLRVRSPDAGGSYLEMAMRTSGEPEALLGIFQDVLRDLDPEQSYWRLRTASDALAAEEQKPRFLVTLMSLLAAIAVTLAGIGLYGVLAYSVSRRRRELGIRMALGAARRRVRTMVVGEGLRVTALGVAMGLLGALWAAPLVEQLLYDVGPHDPATFAVTASLFVLVAAAASLLPARRATGVDPVEVLKAE